MTRLCITKKILALTVTVILLCLPLQTYAAFQLNFAPVQNPGSSDFPQGGYLNTGNPFDCPNVNNPDCANGEQMSTDPSLFFYERVDGYWHIIIGDPDQGFAQEMYTPVAGLFVSNSGGHEAILFRFSGNLEQWSGNGWDPLEFNQKTYGPEEVSFSGNGTGNPTKVVIRQVLGEGTLETTGVADIEQWNCDSGGFCQEFLKAKEGFKPLISQTYSDADITTNFQLDMSDISYTDILTPTPMINTLVITAPGIPAHPSFVNAPNPNSFDMNTDSQDSVVSAGRYIYTVGSGWHNDGDGDMFYAFGEGTYEYVDGVSDFHMDTDWSAFYDATQNPAGSYHSNEARCANLSIIVCDNPAVPY